MAILQTKWIDVGYANFYGTVVTGLMGTGTLSNTQNGSSDVNLDSVYSGADVSSFTHASNNGGYVTFSLTGNRANGAFDTLKIGGVSFARSAATYSYNSNINRTTWTWSSISSSPFGTTAGADKQVTWETTSTVTAPVISGVSNNNAAAATVTATISLSSTGSGGTLQYAQTTSNSAPSSGWSAAPAFSHPRGATRYYWARRDTNTVTSSVSHSVGYLTGDTGFSKTSPTITSSASSATTTIQYATAGETLAIRLNGQSTNLVTAVVASSTSSQNIFFSSSLPSAGSSSTYRFFVRRPTSTGGDGSTFVDTTLTFTVTRAVGAPTASSVTFNNPASANTTATVNLSASGSGGTLEYACEVGDSTPDNWQTSSTFTISRGTGTVYARARRSSTATSSVVSATRPGFLVGDTAVSLSSTTIAWNAPAASTLVTQGTAGETYAVRVNNGSTNLGTAVADSIGVATISFSTSLPSAGNTTTYEIFVLRPTSTGGDGSTYHATNDTFTVTRSAQAPTASSVTFNNPASTSIIATVNLSASGSGGTLEYALSLTDSTPDNWQTSSTFTISRGTGTVYARARRSSTEVSSVVSATRPAFLIGDTGVNPSSTTIGYSDTSEITTVYFGTAGETYAVRLNNGSTNLGTAVAPAGSPSTISISFSTSLPSAGNTTTYEIFVRRPTSTGGDGITYHATNDTFTVTRDSADTTPNAFDFTNQTGVARSTTVTSANTITIGGMSTGVTASVIISGGQYSKNLGAYTSQSGITATNGDTFKLRHTSSSSFSTSTTTTLTVGGVSGSFVSTTLGDNIAPVITVTGTTVNLVVGATYNDAGATATDNIDGNITSSIVTVNPVNTAVVGTYTVTYNVSDASGNAATQKTRTVNVVPIAPVVSNTQTFATTGSSSTSCTISLTSNGSGGTLQYNKSTSTTAPTSGWQSSSTVTGLNRGTAYYLWARQATGYHDRTNSALTPGFLIGDTGVNPSSSTIAWNDNTASTVVTYGTSGEAYSVRVNNGSTNLGAAIANSSGTATISFTSSLPTAGNSTTYEIFVRRPTTTGGDGSTYHATNDTFTVTRSVQPDTGAPVITRLGSATVTLSKGGTYSDAGATAYDTVDGNITSSIVTVNPVNVNAAGTYTVTYNVSDAAGNAATQVTRSVTVNYIAPDTTITDVDTISRPNGSTDHPITIAGGSSNTIYEVRTGSASGTVVGTRTGNGAITVSSIPSAGASATYYITGRVTTTNNGSNIAYLADTYIVLHEAASSGGSTGDGGTGTYGLRVYDASGNTTLDLSDRVVTFRERVTGSLSSSQTSKTVTLSGVGTAVINLDPITVIYVGNIPQRQKILYFTISGTSLTITRTAVNAAGSSAAAQSYDLLVVYDPVA